MPKKKSDPDLAQEALLLAKGEPVPRATSGPDGTIHYRIVSRQWLAEVAAEIADLERRLKDQDIQLTEMREALRRLVLSWIENDANLTRAKDILKDQPKPMNGA